MEEKPKPKKWWNNDTILVKICLQATSEFIKWIFTTLI